MSHAGMAGPRWGRGLTRFQNIVAEGEVDPAATVRKFRIAQPEGRREVARAVAHRGAASLSRSSWWRAFEQGHESLVSRPSPTGWRPPHDQPWRPPYRRQQLRRHGRRPKGHRGVARAQRQRLHLALHPRRPERELTRRLAPAAPTAGGRVVPQIGAETGCGFRSAGQGRADLRLR
jgi:hypothetical protein